MTPATHRDRDSARRTRSGGGASPGGRARTAATVLALALAAAAGAPNPARAELREIESRDFRLVYNAPTLSYLAPYAVRCYANSMRFH
ncbi:MAG TPA: hypothetical protein VLT84_00525, partial [Acidobacteriota bacterium]|nr:hypothetical protein [Acidobacteriota bacterium]